MPTVSVKWQKQIFPAVEIGTSQPPFEFKSQFCALSGVPPERQKIMVQGGLQKGQKLMMMGTADGIVQAP
ncbi:hypothetical protein C4D60_Mb01t00300 [Musa balbisiana]|uniref:ubiquitinyl hydrolase 1 n=1 Tax=Musa balbisiana TaxID=52838 RepID=A0A4S8JIT1_MUSBA|nr:hypothetical protein C4D60_Mb01t00300 [Musa balbisiana]